LLYADAEREGQDSNDCEPRGFAQRTRPVAQLLYEVLNPVHSARVAAFLFGLLDTVQVDSRAVVRLFLPHALRFVFFGFSFELVTETSVSRRATLTPLSV
jgi:hypothetical protein